MADNSLCFDGIQSIANIEAARERLRVVMAEGGDVAVDVSGVTETDLAFIQLLVAARNSAKAAGRILTIRAERGGAVSDAMTRGGLAMAAIMGESVAKGDQQ